MNLTGRMTGGATLLLLAGCATEHRVTVDPVEFQPIVLTVDVNIRIQRELDDFFDFEDTFAEETPVLESIDE